MKLITGNTFPVKEQLKRLPGGARWNAAKKGWEVNDADYAEGVAIVNGTRTASSHSAPTPVIGVRWSAEQEAIFAHFATGQGNAVISARAGTGKTTTIKQAFSHVTSEASEMLYAVFNKKNQIEAMAKISDPRVQVSTLHGLGFSFIKAVWSDAAPDHGIEAERIIATGEGMKLELPGEVVATVEKLVSFAKNTFLGVPTAGQMEALCLEREIFCGITAEDGVELYPAPTLAVLAIGALGKALVQDERSRISFNDMVWLPVAKNWVRANFDLVVVDEAQDMNAPQLEMALLACKGSGRVIVVGDDRQAIYGFRGAASDGMSMMRQRLNARVLPLHTTYRCPKAVVAIAAQIVPDYVAAPSAPEGTVLDCEYGLLTANAQPGDAILSRANAPLMGTCLALLRANIPARIEGRDVGKQLVGMVRKLKARSVPDFFHRLEVWAKKQTARRPKSVDDIADQKATLEAVAEGCASVHEIERRLDSMFSDSDNTRSGSAPCVVLSTVHKAKGLEWNRVFLLEWTFKNKGIEDANIYYVAVTRAKNVLIRVTQ